MGRSAKLLPGMPNPEDLFRKWSKRPKKGGKRKRHRPLCKQDVERLIEISTAMDEKSKREADSKVNKFLAATRRKKLFVMSELTSPVKQAKQRRAIETSEKVRSKLESKAAERAGAYEPKLPVNGFGRGPGRGRGPSKPKVIEIDGIAYSFYPAKAVATQLNLSHVMFWRWRQQGVLPDYCLIDWRGRRWYPEPYLIYTELLGRYRLEMKAAGEIPLWRFKAYAIQLWETEWKEKMPPITDIKMSRSALLSLNWHKYLPENEKQSAEANVYDTGSAFGGTKTRESKSSARRGFRHLRVHASKGSAPQAPAN